MNDPDVSLLDPPTTRRDRSVARVIDPARQRAEARVQRFLDAARELMTASGGDFTLGDVVERSGLSLRSFYQHFGGKHELLLALFEENVRESEAVVRAAVSAASGPRERVRALVTSYYLRSSTGSGPATGSIPALSQFAQSLLTDHPREVAAALLPVRRVFEEVLAEAVRDGVIQDDPHPRRRAAMVLQCVQFNAYANSAVGQESAPDATREAAEALWTLLFHGLAAE